MVAAPAIVVIGDVMTDVGVRPASAEIAQRSDTTATITVATGGAGGNVAAWLGHLNASAGLVARVGDDAAGRAAVGDIERAGAQVRTATDPVAPTGAVVALIDAAGERTMLTDRGANRNLAPDDLPGEWFRAPAHLHLSAYVLFDEPSRRAGAAALQRAVTVGMTISVDPASWAPLSVLGAARFLDLTSMAQLCLPNADEARVLTGEEDPVAAARSLAAWYGSAVVTCGVDGAVWSDGHAVRRQPADPVTVVDATGAGDAFVAGYLDAAVRGRPPAEALADAVRTATSVVGVMGAGPRR